MEKTTENISQSQSAHDDTESGHPEDNFTGATGVLFERAMAQTRMAVCLTDPNQPDNPIIFANRAFLMLTGYDHDEVIGKNCRFLQGPDTDEDSLNLIRKAIRDEEVLVVEVLNYRKDGTKFWNALHLGPIYDGDTGELLYFFGSQWNVSDVHAARADEHQAKLLARELSHRMKNMFSVIGSIVSLTGRQEGAKQVTDKINGRIRALGNAHENALSSASAGPADISEIVTAVLSPYAAGSEDVFIMRGEKIGLSTSTISLVGLVLHELATNATKYGALSADEGKVTLDWREEDGHLILDWKESGGPKIDHVPEEAGVGSGIMSTLLKSARGELGLDWQKDGLQASLRMPVMS
ncbi:PAS domain-containing protein [Parvularcula marina]|uniref:PAS domain-containing protein n=1 Tax=Parvularcula marina TaxID=2292771 RepID=UPI0035135E70